jgi:nitrite reductase (NADH) small subunit
MTCTDLELAVAPIDAIPPGEGRTFEVVGERLALFHTRTGEVFATQAECPHKGGPLADGLVGGRTLICPLHTWKFDLATGEATLGSCRIKTYPVRLDDENRVLVTLTVAQAINPAS